MFWIFTLILAVIVYGMVKHFRHGDRSHHTSDYTGSRIGSPDNNASGSSAEQPDAHNASQSVNRPDPQAPSLLYANRNGTNGNASQAAQNPAQSTASGAAASAAVAATAATGSVAASATRVSSQTGETAASAQDALQSDATGSSAAGSHAPGEQGSTASPTAGASANSAVHSEPGNDAAMTEAELDEIDLLDSGDLTADISEMIKILNLREDDSARLDIAPDEYNQLKTGEPGEVEDEKIQKVADRLRDMID